MPLRPMMPTASTPMLKLMPSSTCDSPYPAVRSRTSSRGASLTPAPRCRGRSRAPASWPGSRRGCRRRPACRRTSRRRGAPTWNATSMSCSINSRVLSAGRCWSSSVSRSRSPRERPDAGSSSSSTSGSVASAIPISSCRFCPWESSLTMVSSCASSQTAWAADAARSRSSRPTLPGGRSDRCLPRCPTRAR